MADVAAMQIALPLSQNVCKSVLQKLVLMIPAGETEHLTRISINKFLQKYCLDGHERAKKVPVQSAKLNIVGSILMHSKRPKLKSVYLLISFPTTNTLIK